MGVRGGGNVTKVTGMTPFAFQTVDGMHRGLRKTMLMRLLMGMEVMIFLVLEPDASACLDCLPPAQQKSDMSCWHGQRPNLTRKFRSAKLTALQIRPSRCGALTVKSRGIIAFAWAGLSLHSHISAI